jgi:hypothetical protein
MLKFDSRPGPIRPGLSRRNSALLELTKLHRQYKLHALPVIILATVEYWFPMYVPQLHLLLKASSPPWFRVIAVLTADFKSLYFPLLSCTSAVDLFNSYGLRVSVFWISHAKTAILRSLIIVLHNTSLFQACPLYGSRRYVFVWSLAHVLLHKIR